MDDWLTHIVKTVSRGDNRTPALSCLLSAGFTEGHMSLRVLPEHSQGQSMRTVQDWTLEFFKQENCIIHCVQNMLDLK